MTTSDYLEVLMIEDRPEDAELAIDSLREHRLANEIKVLEDGQQALDYLFGEEFTTSLPKLILLDLKLPKVSGLEILKRVKSDTRYQHIPIVILTSSNEDSDIAEAYRLGANSYIVKPVNFNKFCEAVKDLGLYWLVLNRSH